MRYPFRFVDLRPLTVVACFGGICSVAGASDRVAEILREKLPRYDPAIRIAAEKREADAAAEKSTETDRPHSATESEPTSRPAMEVAPGVVVLDPVTVNATRQLPRVKLPRIEATGPVDASIETEDPYLLPTERRARLQKKHLSAFDRALNKFSFGFGLLSSGDARAADAERREQFARGAGQVADALQLAAFAGADEAEIKKLRELYLQMLTTRPK